MVQLNGTIEYGDDVLPEESFSSIACGETFNVGCTKDSVFTWETGSFGDSHPPLHKCLSKVNVKMVCAGAFHAMALSEQGAKDPDLSL